ncbi:MAG: hypothetical protein U9Q33_11665 [Campylobacterota bacterium]|nr:hypothetical protein [Campylobacterota bacterium]
MNPFSAKYTPNFPELLNQLGGTIMLTTYQTGKVIMLSSDGKNISQILQCFLYKNETIIRLFYDIILRD